MNAYSPAVLDRTASPGLEVPLPDATLGLVPVHGYAAAGRPESVEDARGNRTTTVYDHENRQLEEIRVSGVRHTYTYEPDGLRRSAFHAGTADVITFIWDGDDLLNERIEGVHAARYAVLDGEMLSEKRGASRYRFVPDPLGSVRALLDTSGSIVATRDYWPYGETAAESGGMTSLQFVGTLGYFTGAVNRIDVRKRRLRPDLGRWTTKDPIGLAGGDWNLYRYAASQPSGIVDPSGEWIGCAALALCGGVALAACAGDPGGVWQCIRRWCVRNPVACGAAVVACAGAAAACAPWLVSLLARLRALLGNGGLLPVSAPMAAAVPRATRDECDPWLIDCQQGCEASSKRCGGRWLACCRSWREQNDTRLDRCEAPKEWPCGGRETAVRSPY